MTAPDPTDMPDALLAALEAAAWSPAELAAVRVIAPLLDYTAMQRFIAIDHTRSRVMWEDLLAAMRFGELELSDDERRLIRIACSLLNLNAVLLGDVLGDLSPGRARAVLGALATAIPAESTGDGEPL